MTPDRSERGAALLSVLLVIAVMATVAATALDRIGIATRLAGNAATVAQARLWLQTAEQLAATRIEDLLAANPSRTTLAGNWMGVERSVSLPDGGIVHVRVEDGGNCFNLNSLVEQHQGRLVARAAGARQFTALMEWVGIPPGEAVRIAGFATSYLDEDAADVPGSAEAGPVANRLMAHPSELRAVEGVSAGHYGILERWLCALPTTDLAPINVNTLRPEQAPLLAMLDREHIDLARARAQIGSRPADGYGSVYAFWNTLAFQGITVAGEASQQVRVKSSFFILRARVAAGEIDFGEVTQIDARVTPVRIVSRHYGESS